MKDLTITSKIVSEHDAYKPYHGLTMPIITGVTYTFDDTDDGREKHLAFGGETGPEKEGYIYSRCASPTVVELEKRIAILEGGEVAVGYASGMGAVCSTVLTFIKCGDHLLTDKAMYSGTFDLMTHKLPDFGVEVEKVDMRDLEAVKAALRPDTAMVYCETITNPTMRVADIEEIAKAAHVKNPKCLVVVDNTFATPLLYHPLDHGADIVIESATKYINGHSDVLAGFAISDAKKAWKLNDCGRKYTTGAVLAPQEAYMVNRGMKTMPVRFAKHCENAMKIAQWMEESGLFKRVYYPGLASHPDHEVAVKELNGGFGGMIAFEPMSFDIAKNMLDNLKLVNLAVSLGDVESLIEHRASMTHSVLNEEELAEAGLTKELVRFSVGIEDADDLIADLKQAVEKAMADCK